MSNQDNLKIAKNLVKIAKEILASPLVDEYNDCKFYLNSNDHRPPHLAVWSGNPSQKADVAITNGNNSSSYADGQIIHLGNFPRNKLNDLKEWFSQENRSNRMRKIMDYILERGEPSWFRLEEIFTEQELNEYNKRKSEKKAFDTSRFDKKHMDTSKPWSPENDFEEMIQVKKCVFTDEYTLELQFADGKRKTFDVKDKIFNEHNSEYRWFKKLQDIDEFKKGHCYGWTVMWDDDRDISAFELYKNDK